MASDRGRLAHLAATSAALVATVTLALGGCATPHYRAPVEDHGAAHPVPSVQVTPPPNDAARVAAEGANSSVVETRAPTYTVKPGDTLMRIALDSGQGWRDLARWNNITDPNVIEVGQVLVVLPPPGETTTVTTTSTTVVPIVPGASTPASGTGFKPLPPVTKNDVHPGASGAASGVPVAAVPQVPLTGAAPAQPVPHDSDDDLAWAWPAAGPVIAAFDDTRTKGLSISGKPGDAVLAAADGKVVYAGSGLRGYGNLVIIKHNANYLTAYAHNQALLVKEDQIVKRGQKIAEMGSTDADRTELHFEIRKQGKPIDPAKLLPPR
jgi:lipoprotein NlpD